MQYVITDYECGNPMEYFDDLQDAIEEMAYFVELDKHDGYYTPRFYAVMDEETGMDVAVSE